VTATTRSIVLAATERLQVAQRRVAFDDHPAAVTAVATVGAAVRNVGLAAEAQAAVTARARRDEYAGLVVKHPPIVDESEPYER
jgi:hypothetical protein